MAGGPWFKMLGSFATHPKLLGLSDADFRRHVRVLCWCCTNGTDGVVTRDALGAVTALQRSRDGASMVQRMEAAGLWERLTDGRDGWQVHGWSEHNPPAETLEAKREAGRERVRRFRARRRDVTPNVTHDVTPYVTHDVTLLTKRNEPPPPKGGVVSGAQGRAGRARLEAAPPALAEGDVGPIEDATPEEREARRSASALELDKLAAEGGAAGAAIARLRKRASWEAGGRNGKASEDAVSLALCRVCGAWGVRDDGTCTSCEAEEGGGDG